MITSGCIGQVYSILAFLVAKLSFLSAVPLFSLFLQLLTLKRRSTENRIVFLNIRFLIKNANITTVKLACSYQNSIKMKYIQITSLFFIMLFSPVFNGCKKNSDYNTFPVVPVNKYVYLNLPPYNTLQVVGNYSYVDDAGYKGLIVYHRSIDEFIAFDRGCTYDPTNANAILNVVSGGLTIKDDNCGSTFNLVDGSVTKSPATIPLKTYRVDYDQTNQRLYIYN